MALLTGLEHVISIDPIDMFSEHIMSLSKQLDERTNDMADVFSRNPNLVQLKQNMHSFLADPSQQMYFLIKRRIIDTNADRTINFDDAGKLLGFVHTYSMLFNAFSPAEQECLRERLAREIAKLVISRHQLKKPQ